MSGVLLTNCWMDGRRVGGDTVQNQRKRFMEDLKQLCQKQGSEEVIEFAAGTLKSMSNLQVMRRTDALDHLLLCLLRIYLLEQHIRCRVINTELIILSFTPQSMLCRSTGMCLYERRLIDWSTLNLCDDASRPLVSCAGTRSHAPTSVTRQQKKKL